MWQAHTFKVVLASRAPKQGRAACRRNGNSGRPISKPPAPGGAVRVSVLLWGGGGARGQHRVQPHSMAPLPCGPKKMQLHRKPCRYFADKLYSLFTQRGGATEHESAQAVIRPGMRSIALTGHACACALTGLGAGGLPTPTLSVLCITPSKATTAGLIGAAGQSMVHAEGGEGS